MLRSPWSGRTAGSRLGPGRIEQRVAHKDEEWEGRLAERQGFEPWVPRERDTAFPVLHIRPTLSPLRELGKKSI